MSRKRSDKEKQEAAGMKVLRDLSKKRKGLFSMLDDMAYNRGLPKPNCVGAYLALLLEEADFSLDGCIETKVGKPEPSNTFPHVELHNETKDADELEELADGAEYSAMLWRAASKIKALGIEPVYKWGEQAEAA